MTILFEEKMCVCVHEDVRSELFFYKKCVET